MIDDYKELPGQLRRRIIEHQMRKLGIGRADEGASLDAKPIARVAELRIIVQELIEQFDAYRDGWITGNAADWRDRIGLPDSLARARAALAKSEG